MSDPKMIKEIKAAVTIPVMAKVRIGHFVEAQVRARSGDTASPAPRARALTVRRPLLVVIGAPRGCGRFWRPLGST